MWDEISRIHSSRRVEVLYLGDFNAYRSAEEKQSKNPPNYRQMENFNNFIKKCSLVDLGFHREVFTWSNKRADKKHVQERLDRGLAIVEWRIRFPYAKLHHGELIGSDHRPIWLSSNPPQRTLGNPSNTM